MTDQHSLMAAAASAARETVADQLHDLVVERQGVGSQGEFVERVQAIGGAARRIMEARGRQRQSLELGLPTAPAARDEIEARRLLRACVMSAAEAAGSWAVGLDLEAARPMVEARAERGES